MRCVNPRRIPNKAATGVDDAYLQVSCGKCYACLSNRRRSWLFRLYNEYINSVFGVFCTLTIEDAFCDGYVHKDDLQKFFKRLRHICSFTYYAIGEYGTTTFRPHYHFCMFVKFFNGTPLELYDIICSSWYYGFCYPSRITYRRLNYILHYHTRPKQPVPGKQTFAIMSKGMGLQFLTDEMVRYLVDTKKTVTRDYNGNIYVIPRYYRKKLIEQGYDIDAPVTFDKDFSVERIEKVFNKKIYELSQDVVVAYIHDLVQKDMEKLKKYNKQDKIY